MTTAIAHAIQHHSRSQHNNDRDSRSAIPTRTSSPSRLYTHSTPDRQSTQPAATGAWKNRHSTTPAMPTTSSPPRPPAAGAINKSPTFDERAAAEALQSASQRRSPGRQVSNPKHSQNVPVIKREKPSSPEPTRSVVVAVQKQGSPPDAIPAPSSSHPHPQPHPQPSRHRPRRLDLSDDNHVPMARRSAGLPSKDSAGLSAMHDVGLACLSPGFQTQDPLIQQNIQRSMDLREQQRQIIEARLHRNTNASSARDGGASTGAADSNGHTKSSQEIVVPSQDTGFGMKMPGSSKRKGPPPGLSIHAPSAHQFATEPRVIQSAPLHQSFTGLRAAPSSTNSHPLSRQVIDENHHSQHHQNQQDQQQQQQQASTRPQLSQLAAAASAANRLPPIQDVIHNSNNDNNNNSNNSNKLSPPSTLTRRHSSLFPPTNPSDQTHAHSAPVPSPSYPPPLRSAGLHPPPPPSSLLGGRPQEAFHPSTSSSSIAHEQHSNNNNPTYRTSDEAVHSLSHGRDDLLPKIVHYGGHQPPTPPSPLPAVAALAAGPNHTGANPGYRPPSTGYAQLQHPAGISTPSAFPAAGPLALPSGTQSSTARRRTREEYEEDYSGSGGGASVADEQQQQQQRRRVWEDGPGVRQARKKEEFLALCARAWELLHE